MVYSTLLAVKYIEEARLCRGIGCFAYPRNSAAQSPGYSAVRVCESQPSPPGEGDRALHIPGDASGSQLFSCFSRAASLRPGVRSKRRSSRLAASPVARFSASFELFLTLLSSRSRDDVLPPPT